jgi:hypothetical protein
MTDHNAADRREYYEMGLEGEPGYFLRYRDSWVGDPGSVRLQQVGPPGKHGWDIVLRIDGTYFNKAEAQEIADLFQAEIHGIVERIRRDPKPYGEPE